MNTRNLHTEDLVEFKEYLLCEEKSAATVEKYLRDVRTFFAFAEDRPVTKELTVSYKAELQERGYALRSVNSMLISVNVFLEFLGMGECRVKTLRVQRQAYCPEETELSKAEYMRLLSAARGKEQIGLVIQTICATGIRVSELQYFTVEAVRRGEVVVHCKNKTRTILIPGKLKKLLLAYIRKRAVAAGAIFVTRSGKPLDRSNIWAQMKRLCASAKVMPSKVFPHNLRKLFARTFYGVEKDLAKLADILGHGSIETTRIYIMTTGMEHRRKMDRLGLVI